MSQGDPPAKAYTSVVFFTLLSYELLLFLFALWMAIQFSRYFSLTNWTGVGRLKIILIKGNVVYFLVWVLCTIGWLDSDRHQQNITLCASLLGGDTVYCKFPSSLRTTPNLTALVAWPLHYGNKLCGFPLFDYRHSYYFAYPKCNSLAAISWYECLATWLKRTGLLPCSLSRSHFPYLHPWRSLIWAPKHWTAR